MAVDTRDRRAACVGFAGPYRAVWPNPSGAVGQGPRQQAAYTYPGILAGEAVAAVSGPGWLDAGQAFVAGLDAASIYGG